MDIKEILSKIFDIFIAEASANPQLARRIESVFNHANAGSGIVVAGDETSGSAKPKIAKRKTNRRSAPVFDPILIVADGEAALRSQLDGLDVEQLKDMVAGKGMDPKKLVTRWKDRKKITDHIVLFSQTALQKGDAFR